MNGVMSKSEVADFMAHAFETEIMETREAGQAEYAIVGDNSFSNFERGAADLGIPREQVLWIFAMKHKDGIASWLRGHQSQREDVTGRIKDLIVYLFLLWAMIEADRQAELNARAELNANPAGIKNVLGVPTCQCGRPEAECDYPECDGVPV